MRLSQRSNIDQQLVEIEQLVKMLLIGDGLWIYQLRILHSVTLFSRLTLPTFFYDNTIYRPVWMTCQKGW